VTLEDRLSGVYVISDPVARLIYVGSSRDVAARWRQHTGDLGAGRHRYQHSLEAGWQAQRLTFELLQRCGPEELASREKWWITTYGELGPVLLNKRTPGPEHEHVVIVSQLRTHRLRQGLTQRELGEKAGLTQVTISKLESGHQAARPSTLRKLARALKVRIPDLSSELPSRGQ
jgi:DNA-binding XRE family transcriptional regulator